MSYNATKVYYFCYNHTYSPVVSRSYIRILVSTEIRNNWNTIQLDCVLAFPQAPVERGCDMKVPKGIEVHINTKWVLKVKNNIYIQRQASIV